jgi:hypothetical protein
LPLPSSSISGRSPVRQLQRFFVEDAAPKSMGEAISRRDDPADGLSSSG